MSLTDLYIRLFGKTHIQDGDVISFAEHGRVGGLSTGQGFKHVMSPGTIDTNNSTTALLNAGQEWTGTATDILNYSGITVLVDADVTGTLNAQFSPDGVDWHDGETYTIPALSEGDAKFFTPPVQGAYFRLHYVNDGDNQSRFHLHTVLKPNPIKWSSHNLNDNLRDDDDAELNVSVLKLRTAQDNYVSGSATNSGNFKVSLEEYNGNIKTSGLPTRPAFGTNDIDEASATITYIGKETEDGTWMIQKMDTSSGISFSYATEASNNSYTSYSTAWSDRASLTYGHYSAAL